MEVFESGKGEVYFQDPDTIREKMAKRSRALVPKLTTVREAVERFVSDGDYIACDLTYFIRGPNAVLWEVIRQRKRDLWFCAKYTYAESVLLAMAGCVSRVDIGFFALGRLLTELVTKGKVGITEWTNDSLTLRLHAGAMGVSFLPTRALLGSDTFTYSGARVVTDPFSRKRVCLVPALNPDIGVVHVHQSDVYGNARVFGASTAPLETAMAATKVIVSTEEIIDEEEVRGDPGKTTIPYYFVDAVVHTPFGAYPGTVPGRYREDREHMAELIQALDVEERMQAYLDKYVYSVSSDEEMLEKYVGVKKLLRLKEGEKIKEGYR